MMKRSVHLSNTKKLFDLSDHFKVNNEIKGDERYWNDKPGRGPQCV